MTRKKVNAVSQLHFEFDTNINDKPTGEYTLNELASLMRLNETLIGVHLIRDGAQIGVVVDLPGECVDGFRAAAKRAAQQDHIH